MSQAMTALQKAMQHAMTHRPSVGGFPYLAETLHAAGVQKNLWALPSCQSLYVMDQGNVAFQGTPLISGMADIPAFDRGALIKALRKDQAGESSFPEFLKAAWEAGVVRYEVDFAQRTVQYFGIDNTSYTEAYPPALIKK